MNKRVHVYYSGRVQGVGFRFTAERIALDLGLRGWVKNLPDAKVELVAEGKEQALRNLLAKIDEVFGRYIRRKDVNWMTATDEFNSFNLRFF